MKLDRAGPIAVPVLAFVFAVPILARAGGVDFSLGDTSEEERPSFFGFVREVSGPGIADAKVTAQVKDSGALVTRTDIMGVYKIPAFGKDVNPDDVAISCAKEGYKEASVLRRPRASGDTAGPIEVECYLQKQ